MKSLDVNVKTWTDKLYGNTYFAGTFVTDYGTETEKTYLLPFQYGYGDQCLQEVKKLLTEFNCISLPDHESLRNYCRENNIILRFNMQENCKKSELKDITTNYCKNNL
jgi:hypothetical protein